MLIVVAFDFVVMAFDFVVVAFDFVVVFAMFSPNKNHTRYEIRYQIDFDLDV